MLDPANATLLGFPAVLVVTQLVAVLRATGLPNRYAPFASLVTGVALVLGAYLSGAVAYPNWYAATLTGVVYGLAASGVYSGVKAVAEKGGTS